MVSPVYMSFPYEAVKECLLALKRKAAGPEAIAESAYQTFMKPLIEGFLKKILQLRGKELQVMQDKLKSTEDHLRRYLQEIAKALHVGE